MGPESQYSDVDVVARLAYYFRGYLDYASLFCGSDPGRLLCSQTGQSGPSLYKAPRSALSIPDFQKPRGHHIHPGRRSNAVSSGTGNHYDLYRYYVNELSGEAYFNTANRSKGKGIQSNQLDANKSTTTAAATAGHQTGMRI